MSASHSPPNAEVDAAARAIAAAALNAAQGDAACNGPPNDAATAAAQNQNVNPADNAQAAAAASQVVHTHLAMNFSFPPGFQQNQQRRPVTSVPPNMANTQMQLRQMFSQQFQQPMGMPPMGMPGFFPANPFVQAQMFLPFAFQSAMAPFYQNVLTAQQPAQPNAAGGPPPGASQQPLVTQNAATMQDQ